MDISELTNIPVDIKTGIDMMPIYAVIGVVVIAQFGTLVSMIIWMLKAAWKASAMNSDIEHLKKDVNEAHKKLRGECSVTSGDDA